MLNIICTIEQITPIFCVFLSIIVSSINSKFVYFYYTIMIVSFANLKLSLSANIATNFLLILQILISKCGK